MNKINPDFLIVFIILSGVIAGVVILIRRNIQKHKEIEAEKKKEIENWKNRLAEEVFKLQGKDLLQFEIKSNDSSEAKNPNFENQKTFLILKEIEFIELSDEHDVINQFNGDLFLTESKIYLTEEENNIDLNYYNLLVIHKYMTHLDIFTRDNRNFQLKYNFKDNPDKLALLIGIIETMKKFA